MVEKRREEGLARRDTGMTGGRSRRGEGLSLIARVDAQTELEQIIDLLERYQAHASASPVLRDIHEVQRLLDYYSFRTPQLADRLAEQLHARYRFELFGLYGAAGALNPRPESSYLYLQQMLGQLVRVMTARLCSEGALTLTRAQLTGSDGLLLQALRRGNAK